MTRPTSQWKLFGIRRPGGEEIVNAVGMIGRGIAFEKWEPIVRFGLSDVASAIGPDVIDRICLYYETQEESTDEAMDELVGQTQQAVAFFTWIRMIPTLDAQHDETGRGKRLGENEKGLTALQEWKDEENIRQLGYEALDGLVQLLDTHRLPFWAESPACRSRWENLLRNKSEFDRYYVLHNHLVFLYITPIMGEVLWGDIEPVIGRDRLLKLKKERAGYNADLLDAVQRPLALLTMATAFRRLSAEILPGGATQLQMTQPVASRLKAEREAREAAAEQLETSGKAALIRLSDMIAEMDKAGETVTDVFTPGYKAQSKGFSF